MTEKTHHYVREATVKYMHRKHLVLPIVKVTTASDVVDAMWRAQKVFPIGDLRERFVMVGLDAQNHPVLWALVTIGTLSTSLVHPREVFAPAIAGGCAAIILAHNHPSGHTEPSHQDMAVAKRLSAAGRTLGIPMVDFIVVGRHENDDYYSLQERGEMPA